jgi:hypothetical protein
MLSDFLTNMRFIQDSALWRFAYRHAGKFRFKWRDYPRGHMRRELAILWQVYRRPELYRQGKPQLFWNWKW